MCVSVLFQSPYGFVPQPYMALQHYSQQQQAQMMQAQAAQAAYCNSQPAAGRMGPADPQRIADSIYSMAAHVRTCFVHDIQNERIM